MVESGRVDHGHHAGSASTALNEAIEFSNAVQAAIDSTNDEETLIIVTADHSHVFTIAGYPKRGNPILGKVIGVNETHPTKANDGQPYTTLGYSNGRGFRDLGAETNADTSYADDAIAGRQGISAIDTTTPGYHQEVTIPLGSETHSGEDVAIHTSGPGAHLVQGTVEQSVIFHLINRALGLVGQ